MTIVRRLLAVALLLAFSEIAHAHGVMVRSELRLTGWTNAEGVFDFAPPEKTDLTITVLTGDGHDSSTHVRAKDLE